MLELAATVSALVAAVTAAVSAYITFRTGRAQRSIEDLSEQYRQLSEQLHGRLSAETPPANVIVTPRPRRTWRQLLVDFAGQVMTSRTRQLWFASIAEALHDFPQEQHAELLRDFLRSAPRWIVTGWYLRVRHPSTAGASAESSSSDHR